MKHMKRQVFFQNQKNKMHRLEQLKQDKEIHLPSLHRREITRFVFIVYLFIFCFFYGTQEYILS